MVRLEKLRLLSSPLPKELVLPLFGRRAAILPIFLAVPAFLRSLRAELAFDGPFAMSHGAFLAELQLDCGSGRGVGDLRDHSSCRRRIAALKRLKDGAEGDRGCSGTAVAERLARSPRDDRAFAAPVGSHPHERVAVLESALVLAVLIRHEPVQACVRR